jgi:hypothetical protein
VKVALGAVGEEGGRYEGGRGISDAKYYAGMMQETICTSCVVSWPAVSMARAQANDGTASQSGFEASPRNLVECPD